ncbi:hypothetical protein [Pedobacter immunditicola]|uniref:hypothetical protein n=1 Tax=Pedobacter immunditicola TaxID=3133440 RepID=UPI0030A2CBBC
MALPENYSWVPILASLVGGGACGAFLKQLFDNRRNKIQSITRSIEIKSFFDAQENQLLNSQLTLKESSQVFTFSNLYSGTIEIINSGLHDYEEFEFGITCPQNVKLIHVKAVSTDRHHVTEINQLPSLENQISSFDINLKPFNRKDIYKFDILATTTEGQFNALDVTISTSRPIKWINPMHTQKIIAEIALEMPLFPLGILMTPIRNYLKMRE